MCKSTIKTLDCVWAKIDQKPTFYGLIYIFSGCPESIFYRKYLLIQTWHSILYRNSHKCVCFDMFVHYRDRSAKISRFAFALSNLFNFDMLYNYSEFQLIMDRQILTLFRLQNSEL